MRKKEKVKGKVHKKQEKRRKKIKEEKCTNPKCEAKNQINNNKII